METQNTQPGGNSDFSNFLNAIKNQIDESKKNLDQAVELLSELEKVHALDAARLGVFNMLANGQRWDNQNYTHTSSIWRYLAREYNITEEEAGSIANEVLGISERIIDYAPKTLNKAESNEIEDDVEELLKKIKRGRDDHSDTPEQPEQ